MYKTLCSNSSTTNKNKNNENKDHKEVTSQVCEGLFADVLKQRDSALAKMFPRFHHAHVL